MQVDAKSCPSGQTYSGYGDNRMSSGFLRNSFRQLIAVALLCAFPVGLLAQDAQAQSQTGATASTSALPQAPATASPHEFVVQDYSKPKRAFPNVIAPYTARHVPAPDLTNTPRIEQVMRDGKIYLSMDDAVALALENNLDIGISRYNFGIADTEILRAKGGANNFFGVNAGIVQNTPGGGVGGLSGNVGSGPGGTTTAPGGIGAGTFGLGATTEGLGPQITSFDPIVSATLQSDHSRFDCTSIFCGAVQNTTTANFNYIQGLQPQFDVGIQISAYAAPFAGLRFCAKQPADPNHPEQPRDHGRCVPASDHHDSRPNRESLLEPGLRLRERESAARGAGVRAENTLGQSEASRDRQPCAD